FGHTRRDLSARNLVFVLQNVPWRCLPRHHASALSNGDKASKYAGHVDPKLRRPGPFFPISLARGRAPHTSWYMSRQTIQGPMKTVVPCRKPWAQSLA
uniref:Uncharacterized protein n=1 Tax=Aegilops tauschii subsp. strangulata TaxID=200361 RepID=A0A453FT34_AEGTS